MELSRRKTSRAHCRFSRRTTQTINQDVLIRGRLYLRPFYGEMPELEELELREGVSVLEDEVIFGNPKLKKVIVPSTVSYLGYRNFEF